jgi:hypothetical protein
MVAKVEAANRNMPHHAEPLQFRMPSHVVRLARRHDCSRAEFLEGKVHPRYHMDIGSQPISPGSLPPEVRRRLYARS